MPRLKYQKDKNDKKRAESYAKSYRERAELAKKKYQKHVERYGPKGKMFGEESGSRPFPTKEQYDKIEIDVPEGLTEEMVTGIVMGAILRKDRLDKKILTSSSIGSSGDVLAFNSTMVLQNYVDGDNRHGEFTDLLPTARQEAKDAIEEYKNGKPEKAKAMLNSFIDATTRSVQQLGVYDTESSASFFNTEAEAAMLAGRLYGQPPFNATGTAEYNDIEKMKVTTLEKQQQLVGKTSVLKSEMINNPPKAGSKERKAMVEELLFSNFLGNLTKSEVDGAVDKEDKMMDRLLQDLGVECPDMQSLEYSDCNHDVLKNSNPKTKMAKERFINNSQKYHVSDVQVLLSQPDGVEKLRKLYHDTIVNSDRFKDLVEANGQEEIYRELKSIGTNTLAKEYKDVKLPEAAKKLNDKYAAAYEKEVSKFKKDVTEAVNESGLLYEEDKKEYGIDSLDKKALEKNAKIVSGMLDELNDHDSIFKKSSQQFKDLKEELKKLKTMAQAMAKKGTEPTMKEIAAYDKMARSVDSLAVKYLDYKTDPKGDYAKERVEAVGQLRRHLNANLKSITILNNERERKKDDDLQAEMNAEYRENVKKAQIKEDYEKSQYVAGMKQRFQEREKVSGQYDVRKNREVFLGNKYNEQDITESKSPAGYSTFRWAAFSVAVMSLAAEGKYTAEQLMDSKQLTEEKAQRFDEVFRRMQEKTPENQQWLAEQIYEGHKQVYQINNELAEKIDFNNPDYIFDKNAMLMENLGFVAFDAWQEMAHCQEEIVALANKENPQIKNYEDLQGHVTGKLGPLRDMTSNAQQKQNIFMDIEKNGNIEYHGNKVMMNAIQEKVTQLSMQEVNQNHPELPYSDRFVGDASLRMAQDAMLLTMNKDMLELTRGFADKDNYYALMPKVLDGSALKDLQVVHDLKNPNPMEQFQLKGLPTIEQLHKDVKYEKMQEKEPEALENIKNSSLLKYDTAEKTASPVHKVFIDKARTAVNTLHDMIKNKTPLVGENRKLAENCVRDIVAEKFIDVMEKRGAKLPVGSEKEIEKTMETLPQFQKATEYIGAGTLGEFAFEGAANGFVKESIADIQKNLLEVKQAEKQAQLEKQAEKQLENPVKEEPKLEAPKMGGLQ